MAVKAVIVAVALVMCIGFLNADKITKEEAKEKLMELMIKCSDSTGASVEDLEVLRKKEVPTSENGKCLLACMYKDIGGIKDGKYNVEGFTQSLSKVFDEGTPEFEKFANIVKTCKDEVGEEENECELAAKIMDCKRRLIGESKHE